MAEDSPKEESKDNLKFFKKAKDQTQKPAEAQQHTEQEAKEETPARAAEPAPEAAPEATPEATPEAPKEPVEDAPKAREPRVPLSTLLAPTVALAIRTLVILAIIVADAFAAYMLVTKGLAPKLAQAQVVRATADQMKPEEPEEEEPAQSAGAMTHEVGTIWPVEDIVVNPSGTAGTRYLCTTVALEAAGTAVAGELAEREAQIRDVLIEILGKRTVDDLSDLQTREIIRAEILDSVNGLLSSGEVVGVYFSNFVLQ
jgi:flagellar FliL protein